MLADVGHNRPIRTTGSKTDCEPTKRRGRAHSHRVCVNLTTADGQQHFTEISRRLFLGVLWRPTRHLDTVDFTRMFNDEVAVSHRRCRPLDRKLLIDGEFDKVRAPRPHMHKITVVEDGAVHFAAMRLVQMLDHAIDLPFR